MAVGLLQLSCQNNGLELSPKYYLRSEQYTLSSLYSKRV